MKKLNQFFKQSIYAHAISKAGVTLVCHTGNGLFVRMPTECWEVIEKYIEDYSPESICAAADKEDCEYYKRLFEKLLDAKILVTADEESIEEVDIILTHRCNLKCIHCCANASGAQGEDFLSTKEWFQIIDILEKEKVNKISITGGEPMVRKDFFELLNYLNQHFSGTLSLATNGTFINEQNVDIIAQSFVMINISVDGYDEETCSKIRGSGVFGRVMHSVQLLLDAGVNPRHISLSMVDTVITHDEIEKFYELCDNLNVKFLIRSFSATGRGTNQKWLQVEKEQNSHGAIYIENEELKDSIRLEHISCQNCNAGRTRITIDPRGNVYPCLVLVSEEYCFGNILLESELLNDIWNYYGGKNTNCEANERFLAFDKLLIKNNERCKKCDVAPFCHMCLDTFKRREDQVGLSRICDSNKDFLRNVVWRQEQHI